MKRAICIFLTISLIFALCGCKKEEESGSGFESFNPEIRQGGTIEAYILRPDTLNPLTTKIEINRRMFSLCFDPLFYIDSQSNLLPRLAKSYKISDNGKKMTIKLREDVKWHNGDEFTAADVIYTIKNITGDENSYYCNALSELISKARTVDDYTVDIYLNYCNSGAAALLTFPIIKKGSGYSEEFTPIGTGAFMISGNTGESPICLKKNPQWKCGRAYADSVNLNILPDEESVFSAFSTGVIDFVHITKENAGKFSVSENIGYLPTYSQKYNFIGINCDNPLLADSDVRAVISSAIDRETFAGAVFSDYAIGTTLPIHPKAYFYDTPSAFVNPPSVEKMDGKLFFRKNAGEDALAMEFTLLVNEENGSRCTAADHIATMLGEKGVSVKVIRTDFETYKARIKEGNFEMYMGSTNLSCDINLHPALGIGGNLNYGNFADAETERLLNKLLAAENVSDRTELLHNIQKEFYAKTPHIPLCFENEMIVYNTAKLGNVHTVFSNNVFSFVTMCCVNK